MAAVSVAYDSVEGAEGRGNIFDNIKFWVARRVPIRDEILNHIKNNRGVIVPLEKQADYLIADRARKDAPPGSCTWQFIVDSVQNGVIQIKDRYIIGPDPSHPRPTSSSAPTKGTRTPFTAQDDADLAYWVLSHISEKQGNVMYQDLEKINPRHTWQSWRNHYVKKLIHLSIANLEAMAEKTSMTTPAAAATPSPAPEGAPSSSTTKVNTARRRAGGRVNPNQNHSGHLARNQSKPPQRTTTTKSAPHTLKDQFYSDLGDFMVANDLDFEKQQVIGGTEIELWDLGQLVEAQNVPPEEVDWMKVAEDLGYDWEDCRNAAEGLQFCFENYLLEFLEAMSSFDIDNEGKAASESPAGIDREESPEGYIPSSPPQAAISRKRSIDAELAPDPRGQKKRRMSRAAEIPSTPEDTTQKGTNQVRSSRSPSLSLGRSPEIETQDAQSVDRQLDHRKHDTDGDQERTPRATLQPQQSSFEITPSQQLHSENLNTSPISLRLGSNSSRKQAPAAKQPVKEPTKAAHALKRSLPASFEVSRAASGRNGAAQRLPQQDVGAGERNRQRATEAENQRRIDECIEYWESLGYPHRDVVEALRRTTMTPGGLAGIVMESLREGKGVPTHYEGIWTDRDDNGLRTVDSTAPWRASMSPQEKKRATLANKERARLTHKHGEERMELRRRFLEAQSP